MGKISKEEIARLEGMKMAYEIAKEHGIEELEEENMMEKLLVVVH